MPSAYAYRTPKGTFRIVLKERMWRVYFEDEYLDSGYVSAVSALSDLVIGAGTWPSAGDPSAMNLPTDLSFWTASP